MLLLMAVLLLQVLLQLPALVLLQTTHTCRMARQTSPLRTPPHASLDKLPEIAQTILRLLARPALEEMTRSMWALVLWLLSRACHLKKR